MGLNGLFVLAIFTVVCLSFFFSLFSTKKKPNLPCFWYQIAVYLNNDEML